MAIGATRPPTPEVLTWPHTASFGSIAVPQADAADAATATGATGAGGAGDGD